MRKLLSKKTLLVFILLSSLIIAFSIEPTLADYGFFNNSSQSPANSNQTSNYYIEDDELDSLLLEEMTRLNIVGISAAFVKDGRVEWTKGYGYSDLERGKPAGPDTIYRIASISKTIGATALMQLWEQGRFELDDDISGYLGYEVRNPNYPNNKITFRMLLTHTSSIQDGSAQGGYLKAINSPNRPPLKDLLVPGGEAYSTTTWGNYKPGTEFQYSNFGSGIIACLVERISGERFNQYCQDHIFKPLGMDASYALADIIDIDKLAVLYKPDGHDGNFVPAYDYYPDGVRPQKQENTYPLGNQYSGPAGGVRSSVTDLAKFMIAHMNGGVYNGVRILNEATVDLMHQMHWFGKSYDGFYKQKGLQFHITDELAGRRLTGHAGQSYGLVSDMYFDRNENTGVIFVTNGGLYHFLNNGFTDIEVSVINHIFDRLAGTPQVAAKKIEISAEENKIYVNGRSITCPGPTDRIEDELFIPAITAADALETEIDFDKSSGVLTLSKGSIVIKAKVGDVSLTVNEITVPLENAPYFKDGHLMIPVKAVAELLGATINNNPVHNSTISENPLPFRPGVVL